MVSGRSIPEIAAGKAKKKRRASAKAAAVSGSTLSTRSIARAPKSSALAPSARSRGVKAPRSRGTAHSASGRAATALPEFIPPSLATLSLHAPEGPGWVHEVKFDGYRMQARLDHGEVRLKTRKGLDWTRRFARVAVAVSKLSATTALIDGEIVVEDETASATFLRCRRI